MGLDPSMLSRMQLLQHRHKRMQRDSYRRYDDGDLRYGGLIYAFQERGSLGACSTTLRTCDLLSRILRVFQDSTGKSGSLPSVNDISSNKTCLNTCRTSRMGCAGTERFLDFAASSKAQSERAHHNATCMFGVVLYDRLRDLLVVAFSCIPLRHHKKAPPRISARPSAVKPDSVTISTPFNSNIHLWNLNLVNQETLQCTRLVQNIKTKDPIVGGPLYGSAMTAEACNMR